MAMLAATMAATTTAPAMPATILTITTATTISLATTMATLATTREGGARASGTARGGATEEIPGARTSG
eukprot:286048-Alexandrium_andersonii.AAC.1